MDPGFGVRKSHPWEGPVVVRADDGGNVSSDRVQHVLAHTLLRGETRFMDCDSPSM